MIAFRCLGEPRSVSPGGWFSAQQSPESVFSDTPSTTLRRLTAAIAGGAPWAEVVACEYAASNPWLHQIVTSPKRDLFFRTQCVLTGQKVLDVGSGWGQQALVLAKTNEVCAVEPNSDRLGFVRAVAQQVGTSSQLYFLNADLLTLELAPEFDAITCIGVLEWAANFNRAKTAPEAQREFLERLYAALKPGGQCIIGIENRLGLKYLLGARDDHTGMRHLSTLHYARANERWQALHHQELRVITHSRAEYQQLLGMAGFSQIRYYAAYPDYKLPEVILPCNEPGDVNDYFRRGGFVPEHDGWDGTLLSAPEQAALASHYSSLAEMGIAHHFAPSFYMVARK